MTAPEPQPAAEPSPAGSNAVVDLVTLLQQVGGSVPAPAPAPPEPAPAEDDPEPSDEEPDPAAAAEPAFDDLDAFMTRYLAPVVERRVVVGNAAGLPWCPQWWRHPEAISRFYALWRAWETLRISDPDTGMSIWWRDHFDNHFAVLTGEYGPFGKCSPDRGHVATAALPIEPAPKDVLAQLPDYDPRPASTESG